ncbi:cassette chromosome recombinase B domain protein [Rickettsia felis str. Pedreira]|uniref:Cassette chromosome recombinase B domain protein n=1 Tax=Rickettsia felis str. Pedreira TaxID=1359196 RepID=A0A0F3MUJ9_RICFI|nr:cassette chromosome recombinase B domain protein [Rickettsia felis str. Pedreira]
MRLGRKQGSYKYKEFIFRGLIKCGNTGKVVTSVIKKGVYTYLIVWDATNPERAIYIKEEKVLEEVEEVLESLQLEPKFLQEIITYITNSVNAEHEYYKKRIKELNAESIRLKDGMDRLMNLYIKGQISEEKHEEKRLELEQKRKEITKEIETRDKDDDSFTKMLVSLISTASSAYKIFKSSSVGQKRRLINLIFGNLILKPGKLDFMLRSPFDTLVNSPKTGEWYPRPDLNRQELTLHGF